jgi:hypothetical protein
MFKFRSRIFWLLGWLVELWGRAAELRERSFKL